MKRIDKIKSIGGFMDGDGCIGIYRVKRSRSRSWHYILNVIFAQSRGDKMKVLKDIKSLFGGCLVEVKRKKNHHRAWALRLTGWGAHRLIKEIIPYMRVREKQAKLALKFMEYRKINSGAGMGVKRLNPIHLEYYEKCRLKMNWYNRRGTK